MFILLIEMFGNKRSLKKLRKEDKKARKLAERRLNKYMKEELRLENKEDRFMGTKEQGIVEEEDVFGDHMVRNMRKHMFLLFERIQYSGITKFASIERKIT